MGFYERRIKRLVPALVVFVLITSILICLFNPDPTLALKTGGTSLFGLSNLYLLRQSTDYFAQSTELNPFTHTWSLGVEEQFYLLFPFLIWFSGFGQQTANGARNLFLWVGALTIASLIGFIYLYQVNQPAAYFLMPSRFWEMAAGCLIFIGFQRREKIEQALEQVSPFLVAAAMVGVMFLPVSAAVPATIGIVVLSAILIACLKPGTATHKFFTHDKVVFTGLISYSLYLWHWTVLSTSRWTTGIHWWSIPFQVALMLCLAIASYRLIETPLRKRAWSERRWKTLLIGAGVLAATSGALIAMKKDFHKKIYSGDPLDAASSALSENILPNSAQTNSALWALLKEENSVFAKCPASAIKDAKKENRQKIFFIGDSHTEHLRELIASLSSDCLRDVAFAHFGGARFPPVRWSHPRYMSLERIDWFNKLLVKSYRNAIASMRSGDVVVLSSSVHYLFDSSNNDFPETVFYSGNERITKLQASSRWLDNLNSLADDLARRNISLVILGPLPYFGTSNESPGPGQCSRQWFNQLRDLHPSCPGQYPALEKKVFEHRFKPFISALKRASSTRKNVFIFEALDHFCDATGHCRAFENKKDGRIYFKDDDHLSPEGARLLGEKFLNWGKKNMLFTSKT